MFDTNFLGHQPSGPTSSLFMFISKILSVIRADFNVIFSKFVSPDEESLADGPTLISNTVKCMGESEWMEQTSFRLSIAYVYSTLSQF